jgi:hypothetical protein
MKEKWESMLFVTGAVGGVWAWLVLWGWLGQVGQLVTSVLAAAGR